MNSSAQNPPPPRPRGARADAETAGQIYLVKNVSRLRATYQVKLLALKAAVSGRELVLQVPRTCRFDSTLEELARAAAPRLRREDLP